MLINPADYYQGDISSDSSMPPGQSEDRELWGEREVIARTSNHITSSVKTYSL